MLVEVLATMTISALLLAALFSITSLTMRVSGRIEKQSQRIEERTRLLSALTREIERAVPMRWAGENPSFIFIGSERNLAFAAVSPSANGGTEIRAISIDSEGDIARRVAVVGPDARSFADLVMGAAEVMADKRYRLAFAYFARLPDGREALVQAWPNGTQFPVAVRLTVSSPEGGVSSIRINFAVDAEPGCGFPGGGRCGLRPAVNKQSTVNSIALGGGG